MALASATLLWCGPAGPEAGKGRRGKRAPGHADWAESKARVRGWLDGLEIDQAELTRFGVKGKKKLSELFEAYLLFFRHTTDPEERARILERVEPLVEQTRSDEYHNLEHCRPRELNSSSMPYLHVASLIQDFEIDTSYYLTQIRRAKPRLNAHLVQTRPGDSHRLKWGAWPLVRFAQFYERYELEPPAVLRAATLNQGAIRSRSPLDRYSSDRIYDLTHEILIVFDWGRASSQDVFDAEDLSYARETMAALTLESIEADDPDLVGSLVTDLCYLGLARDPAARRGLLYLLDAQNENGSWGDYESHRPKWGEYLEAHAYLHTTLVTLRGLFAAYEGDFPRALP